MEKTDQLEAVFNYKIVCYIVLIIQSIILPDIIFLTSPISCILNNYFFHDPYSSQQGEWNLLKERTPNRHLVNSGQSLKLEYIKRSDVNGEVKRSSSGTTSCTSEIYIYIKKNTDFVE